MNDDLKNSTSSTALTRFSDGGLGDYDGFGGYDDEMEDVDDEGQRSSGLLQGYKIKFPVDAFLVNGEKLDPALLFLVVGRRRVVQWWGRDGHPDHDKTREIDPNEKFPNIEAMNKEEPRSAWRNTPSGLKGPWECQQLLYLRETKTGQVYTYPAFTGGFNKALRDLNRVIEWACRYHGADMRPIIRLRTAPWSKQYNKVRPDFVIVDWRDMGGRSDGAQPLLPGPIRPSNANQALAKFGEGASPAEEAVTQGGVQSKSFAVGGTVNTPSLAEEMNDQIPDFGSPAESPPAPPPKRKTGRKATA